MDVTTVTEGTPAKKTKPSCKYRDQWGSEFNFLKRSRVGDSHAFCKFCNCDFSISHGGRNDVGQHEKSAKHKRGLEAQKHAQAMSAFVTRNATEADQVTHAEVKMAMLCAKNNIPFSFHDDFNKYVADMFRTLLLHENTQREKLRLLKSSKLITGHSTGAIAAELEDELAKTCRSQPFSLMCDESNNRKTDKEFVILTRLYDEATLQVATRFLEMPICNIGNAENLYEKLSEALRKRGIPWDNLIAFNSDNASVMKGRHNSVISRLKTSQPHVQDLGCICHLVQLATGCGIRAAQAYFNSHEEVERSVKVRDLASHLRDPIVKTYFLFLSAALKPLSEFNIAFQSEGVQIHKLEEEMSRLMKRFLGYLIPARAIVAVPLREVEYGDGHQLADEDLFIGADTKTFMRSGELPVSAEKKIFQTVRNFYEAVLKKMFSSFPFDHPLLRDLKVLDPAARLNITPGTVERLRALFPQLRLKEDKMREEFIDYQVTDSKELPQEDRIDRFWGMIGKDMRFSELPKFMKALLCIPHSNASSERVFSMCLMLQEEEMIALKSSKDDVKDIT
ncbi:hypothetical protein E1301_Tti022107 [Triplophysa tibetana]|uniref:HAT C-terminal dimerisation domain-containing protein n=1 Tax=Triplophysa tibetana TaxID=1572043 RepID=A0A5A9PLV2_9TELE|nr:hypothetical protein E1301_Tti022107 [Triplophysa tibetana]